VPEFSEKVDIYALGLILLEMSTDIDRMTYHEKNATFDLLKKDRIILSNHNLENFEKELILALTEIEP
jgi:3-dehydroquinate dehydratase